MAKKKVDMKKFIEELEGNVDEGATETLAWIAEETDPITEWKLIQTTADSSGEPLSFIVFSTASGNTTTLPLVNEHVSSLIYAMITSTPNLSPKSVPYIPDKTNFFRKYKKQLIFFSAFMLLFTVSMIASIIVSSQEVPL